MLVVYKQISNALVKMSDVSADYNRQAYFLCVWAETRIFFVKLDFINNKTHFSSIFPKFDRFEYVYAMFGRQFYGHLVKKKGFW